MNPFEALQLPEKACLEESLIKERFQNLSRDLHPDSADGDATKFAEINAAYQALLSVGSRLRTLLALRLGERFSLKGAIAPALLNLFAEAGPTLQDIDRVIDQRRKATTALGLALIEPQLLGAQERLMRLQGQLAEARRAAEVHLPSIDQGLEAPSPSEHTICLSEQVCRTFLYLDKWEAQLQARFHALLS